MGAGSQVLSRCPIFPIHALRPKWGQQSGRQPGHSPHSLNSKWTEGQKDWRQTALRDLELANWQPEGQIWPAVGFCWAW